MPRKIEEEIERLSLLRDAPRADAVKALRKALGDRVNLVAARAARLTGELRLDELLPDLLRLFDRLLENGAERDPKCWAKNAIAKALVELDYRDSPPFLRGARHVQMEPAFIRPEDTAIALRGICLLALPPCADLTRTEVLRVLVEGLTDEAQPVRIEAARALEQMAGESAMVLRLKARIGDEEPAVCGQVFDSLLALEREQAVAFVAGFMKGSADTRAEAALALGASRLPEAVQVVCDALDTARDLEYRRVLLRALSVSRQESAIEFLLDLVMRGRTADAEAALEALELHRQTPEIRRRVEAAELHRKERMDAGE